MVNTGDHLDVVHQFWKLLKERTNEGSYELDGDNLHIAEVVATAQRGSIPKLSQDPKRTKALQDSVNVLFDHLAQGWYVYVVDAAYPKWDTIVVGSRKVPQTFYALGMVSFPIIKAMANLLEHNLTPVVPLRGSVSASGDLMPLSYVAGSLEGNPDVLLEINGKVLPSHIALQEAGLNPISLGPKEGLSLINGTSSSAGLGALVIGETHLLAFLTQVLSAGAVEALRGSSESFHPFIAKSRPHPGQIESARNIFYFLSGSHLSRDVLEPKNRRREDLVQDRYSLRSAPQWIGPQLEDLLLADQQIRIELNSSCDNPLVDSDANDIYYGCNFQAASVTSAMEKVRLALQMFGRILFAQSTEMIDPHLSGGLPANLAADNPSLSFTMKGVDVNMAAYMAELSYLANPISSHVQAAEMHNQSVNSMALASARMSFDAVEILKIMCACSVFVVCQALDLRSLHAKFVHEAKRVLASVTTTSFSAEKDVRELDILQKALEAHIDPAWSSTGKLDLHVRCNLLVTSAVPILVSHSNGQVADILHWQTQASKAISDLWEETFAVFRAAPHTPSLLGKGSRVLYEFVRNTLGVPFHEGFVEHPTIESNTYSGRSKKTIGGWISIIHASIEDRSIYDGLLSLAEEGLLCIDPGHRGG
ncbi:hypothetical protein ZTR_09025 [Talaromyces verruculosus]|nr:hypothetical protein ZTR_09025 [Talaromyces verruculosus]